MFKFQGRRLFKVISAPIVSNVSQPHQIFSIKMDFLQFPEIEREKDGHDQLFLAAVCRSHPPRIHTIHTQHTYSNMFSDHEYVVCHVCKMSSHSWHCHVSFTCLLSYAILLLIMHHWTCDKYLFIFIYGGLSLEKCSTLLSWLPALPLIMCRNVTHSDTVTVDEIGISRMNVIY